MNRIIKYSIVLMVMSIAITWDSKKTIVLQANIPGKLIPKPYRFEIERVYAGELTDNLDVYFRKFFKRTRFNGNVLVAKKGKVIYETCVGYSNMRTKEKLTRKSAFQLASVSKQFTAMGIMMLEEANHLSYSDTLQKFIPELPYSGITIEHLLTHRSGLPNYMYFCDAYTDRTTPVDNEDIIDIMIEYEPNAYFPPDRRFKYSNTGYALLALIIERIYGKSYEEFMEEEIFKPLEMNNSFVFRLKNEKDFETDNMTTGYHGWRVANHLYLDGVVGDKGIYSTTEDLLKWDYAIHHEQLVSQNSLEKAFQSVPGNYRYGRGYGFGWRIRHDSNDNKIVYHGGWWRGYNTSLVRDLDNKYTIIILGNRYNKSVNTCFLDVLNILNKKDYSLAEFVTQKENLIEKKPAM